MSWLLGIFSSLNLVFGILIVLPCLMMAGMSGDNPKAVESKFYPFLVWFILTLPLLFLGCAIAGFVSVYFSQLLWGFLIEAFPWVWLFVFILVNILMGNLEW